MFPLTHLLDFQSRARTNAFVALRTMRRHRADLVEAQHALEEAQPQPVVELPRKRA